MTLQAELQRTIAVVSLHMRATSCDQVCIAVQVYCCPMSRQFAPAHASLHLRILLYCAAVAVQPPATASQAQQAGRPQAAPRPRRQCGRPHADLRPAAAAAASRASAMHSPAACAGTATDQLCCSSSMRPCRWLPAREYLSSAAAAVDEERQQRLCRHYCGSTFCRHAHVKPC